MVETVMKTDDISNGVEKTPILFESESKISSDEMPYRDYVYVRCNIPGPDYSRKTFAEQFQGCTCVTQNHDSCEDDCKCTAKYGCNYNNAGKLIIEKAHLQHQNPIIECNNKCKCKRNCRNRIVQNGVNVKLTVFQTDKKGLGVKARETISKNTFVCEYAGEVLIEETAQRRISVLEKTENMMNYMIILKEHLGSGEIVKTIVDPSYIGNVGRFINHSCDPNLFMVPVRVNNPIPKLALFALRDIEIGEEITFSYSGIIPDNSVTKAVPLKENKTDEEKLTNCDETPRYRLDKKKCYCGSDLCSGYLPFDDTLLV